MTQTTQKSAFITGASKGIGHAVAQALIADGYAVTITSRNADEIAQVAAELGAGARGVACDVKEPRAVQAAVDAHVAAFGGLDVLFVNAGVGHFGNVADLSIEQWQDVIDTNLSGAFYTVKAAIPALSARGGYIFTLSSLAGKNPLPGGGAYNASKFGLNGLSEVLNLDLRDRGIKVTQIMPGSVATHFGGHTPDQDKDAWKIQPEDLAQLTVDLLHMPERTLPSRVEVRPSRPPKK
ncbi:SDR family oxidoreductase [Deinococcus soli (ex Cha et al. 2016)]|jgi:NAD(P)-dependent dehydrogenase (short-subunit alcohol dehydrogenase family)|uniref:NAD(P)-dependent dehydrogenase (Short-subunit alcohol dehydrogenase family) n=2 Tax=Deinococcus soli (ex Cha et al. 2016) TaxID=1309411 RepID=A0AAE3XJ22_9DEIO|nr:SDR family oxidoreductase [Deinococcus soli (ex Cha et al. 2016)]MDR6220453.1 NAD(P)-dependent dehydrogenase (short-subunit alcohol dehydrogenase family) [Deinococcus soli (ex Cha et al. 2016)]MDR6330216.1 NAD(P)-dependent dehydrogenase (short-subunit alcohol dehydrogenase family) [Deinococcus soli (ex Cha et al. 2016)]MDR6753534.1 NAD(P)-dependent dehydrogenase (short-subunit alcohol dehydrogenase family) [Deinococcus soli (ex Cha et al. 2016)]